MGKIFLGEGTYFLEILSASIILKLLHSEKPKLYAILAFLSAIGLKTHHSYTTV